LYVIAEPEVGSKLRLRIFVEKPAVDKAYQKLYQDLSKRGDVPGFRPGHVPPWRARRHFGAEMCDQSVFGDLVEEGLTKALTYGELQALEPAGFEDEMSATEGQPLQVEATLVVRPEAHIPPFDGIEFEVPDPEPTEEQIDTAIRSLLDAAAEAVAVERQDVQKGDLVDVTLKTKVDGEEGDEEREESFIVGEGRYDPALDEHIVGHSVGQTVEFEVEYPARRSMGDLAGKKVAMAATITGLRERHVPELNDDFAAKAAEVETAAALREKVAQQARRENEEVAEAVLEGSAARWLRQNVRVDVPASFEKEAAEAVPEASGGDLTGARHALSVFFACQQVLEGAGVEVTDDDVKAEYVETGRSAGLDINELAQEALTDDIVSGLRERVMRRKALAIVSRAAARKVVPWTDFLERGDELTEAESVEEKGTEVPTEEPSDA